MIAGLGLGASLISPWRLDDAAALAARIVVVTLAATGTALWPWLRPSRRLRG